MKHAHALRLLQLCLCLATLFSALPSRGTAQQQYAIHDGARIRLRTAVQPSEWQVGTLLSHTSDSIRIQFQTASSAASLPLQSILRLELSRGIHSQSRKGARIGVLAGVGAGLLFIPAAVDACENSCVVRVPAAVALLAGVLGGVGAGIGALVGAASHGERWEPVSSLQPSMGAFPRSVGPPIRSALSGPALDW